VHAHVRAPPKPAARHAHGQAARATILHLTN
jgi:hypothetical protein